MHDQEVTPRPEPVGRFTVPVPPPAPVVDKCNPAYVIPDDPFEGWND